MGVEWFSEPPQGIARLQLPHKHLERLEGAITLFSSQLELSTWGMNSHERAS